MADSLLKGRFSHDKSFSTFKFFSVELIKSALDYCRTKKVKIVEAYPIEPKNDKMPEVFAWTGFASAFVKAGFKEAARFSPTRPIKRYELK